MKRLPLHLLFWCAYFALKGLIEYLWLQGSLPGFSEAGYIAAGLQAALLEGLPEVIFAYYLAYRSWPRFENRSICRYRIAAETVIVLLVCIYVVRIIFYYVVAPYVLKGLFPASAHFEFKRFVVIFFNFIATSGVMVAIKSVRQQLVLKEREKNLVKEKLETELKFLRNQMNPHFLFNTLNNIYALAQKKSDKTAEAVMKLSQLLDFILYRSGKDYISLNEEIKIISDYITLEKLRYDNKLSIRFEKEVDDERQPIGPLLLLPLVENAFKHGVANSRFNAFIDIKLHLKKEQFQFSVSNSFESDELKNNQNEPIGLKSIKRQLALIYREHDLKTESKDNIFTVQLYINLRSDE